MVQPTWPQTIDVRLFRDWDPTVCALPKMDLGESRLLGDPCDLVAGWFRRGARRIDMPGLVDLSGGEIGDDAGSMLRRLAVLRELTSHGMAAGWALRLTGGDPDAWRALGHLYPPAWLEFSDGDPADADSALSTWRAEFRIAKCHFRRGPGFLLIRDWRYQQPVSTILEKPEELAACGALEHDAITIEQLGDVAAGLLAGGLVAALGGHAVWLPCQLRRWPAWLNHVSR